MVLSGALVVLFDEVVDGLPAEYPVGGVEVGLVDGGGQHDAAVALGLEYLLDAGQNCFLLREI